LDRESQQRAFKLQASYTCHNALEGEGVVMNVFATAEQHMSWLAARQSIAASNMANSDTPNFKAREIEPFGKELQRAATRLATSHAAHLQVTASDSAGFGSRLQKNEEASLSGNDVVLEKEMRTAGENSRLYSFDIGLLKSFHRMMLASVRS
jgi:flagellar basal-body rod protein FlgB